MKYLLRLILLAAAFAFPSAVNAATCFWVGGVGNYDNINSVSWSSSSGGTVSTCAATGGIPKNAGDIAIFDGSSGGGTIVVCGTLIANCPTSNGLVSLAQITMGAFTGTLDFATNNPAVTLSTAFSCTGTGTRTLSMGSGTWTLTGTTGTLWDCSTVTNFTLNANTSTVLFSSTPSGTRNFTMGAKTLNNLTVTNAAQSATLIDLVSSGAFTISGTFTLTNVLAIRFPAGTTVTIANLVYDGNSTLQGMLFTIGGTATISTSGTNTLSYLAVQNMTKTGAGSITVNNGFNSGGNTGFTINAPAGGGGRIIGG